MSNVLKRAAAGIGALAAAVSLISIGTGTASAAEQVEVHPGSVIKIQSAGGGSGSSSLFGSSSSCTLAYIATSGGSFKGLTAGHCGNVGDVVFVNDTQIGTISKSHAPTTLPGGLIIGGNTSPDWAVIDLNSNAKPVSTLSGGGAANVEPTNYSTPKVGDKVCGQGLTSGRGCGTITAIDGSWISTTIKRAPGDSGGPLYSQNSKSALGILSSVTTPIIGGGDATSRYYSLKTVLDASGTTLYTSTSTVNARTTAPVVQGAKVPAESTPIPLPQFAAA